MPSILPSRASDALRAGRRRQRRWRCHAILNSLMPAPYVSPLMLRRRRTLLPPCFSLIAALMPSAYAFRCRYFRRPPPADFHFQLISRCLLLALSYAIIAAAAFRRFSFRHYATPYAFIAFADAAILLR